MTLPHHLLPGGVLDELAAGRGGADAVARLRSAQHSKTLLLVRALTLLLGEAAHPDLPAVEAAYRVLAGSDPRARAAALGHPPVAAWAFGTASLLRSGRSAPYPGLLAAVAVVAAVRAGADADLDVPLPPGGPGRLDLPGLGTLAVPAGATRASVRCVDGRLRVRCAGERVEVDDVRAAGPGWTPLPRMGFRRQGLPLSLVVDTPGWQHVPGVRLDGPRTDHRWRHRLDGAWRLLVDDHRPVAEEVSAAMRVLIPVRAPRAGTRSGTFHHAFGSVAMSHPLDARTAAVTLAHEIQHLKLAALADMFALLEPGPTELFYAPWRTDPRPLEGLLHGAYAHLGVARFWRRQADTARTRAQRHHARVEGVRWSRAVADVLPVLCARRRLTPVGRRLVDGMARVLDGWAGEPVAPDAAAEAGRLLAAHRARWDHQHAPTG
ncbi:HEXXH motif domain-containing protein [Micromonospora sp. WMMD1128]|uniref:HEXXH motif domain-containing protein n=1 Tax=Micromonospora sp. WMMD1128 TaxID=3015150 RepID=UPI00248ABF98|nr:HEXXH motif domain-containing protein [Micromonospora sp. WMMD1128]WBB73077.1 HEXXH motif domain-containing protein [Micromonospora sp. WMMD1128]